jgi:hypothetical protein
MKSKYILFSIIPFLLYACASLQTLSINEPFIKVYENLEDNQNQLFVKANEWMVKTFTKSTSVIEFSDKAEGTLIGKYLMSGEERHGAYGTSADSRVYAKIDIRVKDGKARISIEPLGTWQYDPSGFTFYNYSLQMANADMNALAQSFYDSLKTKKVDF